MEADEEKLEISEASTKVSEDKLTRYSDIRTEALALYNSFRPVSVPALKGKQVVFTSEGFNHLVYRIPKQERNKKVQIMRFELLEKARELLALTTTFQEYEEYPEQIKVWRNKKKVEVITMIHDFGFIGVIRGFRIKVVVRKKGNGNFEFLSVIPAWSTKYYRGIKIVRQTKGNVAD